jgi:hypothetical protein
VMSEVSRGTGAVTATQLGHNLPSREEKPKKPNPQDATIQ